MPCRSSTQNDQAGDEAGRKDGLISVSQDLDKARLTGTVSTKKGKYLSPPIFGKLRWR